MVFALGIGKSRDSLIEIAIDIAAHQNFSLIGPQEQGIQPLKLKARKTSFFQFIESRVVNHRKAHKPIIPQEVKETEKRPQSRGNGWQSGKKPLRYSPIGKRKRNGTARMSDLLQEIDEALKRERAEKLWREYGPTLIAGIVLLVVLTGVFAGWNAWQEKHNIRQTNLLISALETPYPETALKAASTTLSGNHKALAQLQLAGYLAQNDKNDEALAQYQDIAAERGTPAVWRDLATLMAARLEWHDQIDEAKAKALLAGLKPLLNKNNPWRMHAAIQSALITGDSLGDYKGAVQLLADPVNNANTPASLQNRARALDHFYTMKLSAQQNDGAQADEKNQQKG